MQIQASRTLRGVPSPRYYSSDNRQWDDGSSPTVYGKSHLVVIMSEAKNPSEFWTKG
jgi:hypothetical protein